MFNNLTVLVVEDNDAIRFFLEQALTQMGVGRVIPATTWYEVQNKIEGVHLDGAFLDLVLQHGSGLDIARSLTAMNVPVIFCSGVADEYNIKQMYRYGFVFEKPLHLHMLHRGLEYFKSLKGVGRE
jgi:DNA-binding response OmpR family regulator